MPLLFFNPIQINTTMDQPKLYVSALGCIGVSPGRLIKPGEEFPTNGINPAVIQQYLDSGQLVEDESDVGGLMPEGGENLINPEPPANAAPALPPTGDAGVKDADYGLKSSTDPQAGQTLMDRQEMEAQARASKENPAPEVDLDALDDLDFGDDDLDDLDI